MSLIFIPVEGQKNGYFRNEIIEFSSLWAEDFEHFSSLNTVLPTPNTVVKLVKEETKKV